MAIKRTLTAALAAAACLLAALTAAPAQAKVDFSSPRIIRNTPIPQVNSDFAGTALSTFSIKWTWSTGTFTNPIPDGYYLYSSTASTPATRITLPPNTTFYVDTGIGTNRPVTRWVTAYNGADQSNDSPHVIKHTYATPPSTFTVSDVDADSGYFEWHFSSAAAYAIEGSTDGGATYVRLRDAFVPWQTVDLLSNRNYKARLGAINLDNELTPGLYSDVENFTTMPLTPTLTAVAVSSFAIQWTWSTGTYTGSGITGYKVYRDSVAADGTVFEFMSASVLGADTTYWIETYVDSYPFVSANSQHESWLRADGILDSYASEKFSKYTYGIVPPLCTSRYYDPDPYEIPHMTETSVRLTWAVGYSSQAVQGVASSYLIQHSTVSNFTTALGTVPAGGPPADINDLTTNTKYDFIVRPVNGDNEVTPVNAFNPYARTAFYKAMTRPAPPANFVGTPRTDTILSFVWSTSTYLVNPDYIDGYNIGVLVYDSGTGLELLQQTAFVSSVTTHEYNLDYLMTNSTHTRYIWTSQVDPVYDHAGSFALGATGATFATPPNDVTFGAVGAHSVTVQWNEPIVPATKYRIERSTNLLEVGPWVFVASATGVSYLNTGLTPSTTYSYRIGAINQLGLVTDGLDDYYGGHRRDYSFVRSTMTKHIAPAMTGVAYSSTTLSWSWTDAMSGVTAYNLYTATGGVIASGLAGAATFYIETVAGAANTAYTRRLRSVADGWEGDYSEATVYSSPNPPSPLTVTSSATHSLGLGWTANGSTRYALYRSTDAANWTALRSWTDVFVSTSYADTALHYGATYYYAVRGYNYDGFLSASSATAVNMTLPLPSTYTIVYATAAAAQTVTAPLAGLGLVTVTVPAGSTDGYFVLSTSPATAPAEVTLAGLNSATAKLTNVTILAGSMVELRLYNSSGTLLTANLPAQARLTLAYPDADSNDEVDGTSPVMDARTLRMFTLNAGALTWDRVNGATLDRTAKTVYADLPHFSIYMLGSVTSAAGALSGMYAYPNPYRPGSAGDYGQSSYGDGIVFESIPARSKVRIYSVAGAEVAEIGDLDGNGRAFWDTRNKDGGRAASGVYFYVVTQPTGSFKKSGRIAIIR